MRLAGAIAGLAGLLATLPALAQAPELTGPEGSVETSRIERELDEYPLPVAPFGGAAPTVRLTGAVTWTAWRLPAEGQTVLSVMQGYRRAVADLGYRALLECSGEECGGFDFRFEVALLPPPGMAMDVQNFAQLSAEKRDPATYASILVSQVRDSIYIQIVTVLAQDPNYVLPGTAGGDAGPDAGPTPGTEDGAAPPDDHTPAEATADAEGPANGAADDGAGDPEAPAAPDAEAPADGGTDAADAPDAADDAEAGDAMAEPAPVVEDRSAVANRHGPASVPVPAAAERPTDAAAAPPEAGAEAPDTPDPGASLLENLVRFGHVPVDGLDFESGGAALTEASGPALDRMAQMLIDNPDLRIAIVGHSDNQGSLRVNISISEKRAAAVREAMIARGIDGDRMEARGIGYLAPLRSNVTEEGRGLNRRVELVLRDAE